jgi:hypothetical protein
VDFTSKSKIPPQLVGTLGEVREHAGNLIEAFGFHGDSSRGEERELYRTRSIGDPRPRYHVVLSRRGRPGASRSR